MEELLAKELPCHTGKRNHDDGMVNRDVWVVVVPFVAFREKRLSHSLYHNCHDRGETRRSVMRCHESCLRHWEGQGKERQGVSLAL